MGFYLLSLLFWFVRGAAGDYALNDPAMEEFRAVWIATVNNIDWPSSNTVPPAQQQQELIEILDTVQRLNMNVVIFHVRKVEDCLSKLISDTFFLLSI